jgi:hypothetical protein
MVGLPLSFKAVPGGGQTVLVVMSSLEGSESNNSTEFTTTSNVDRAAVALNFDGSVLASVELE